MKVEVSDFEAAQLQMALAIAGAQWRERAEDFCVLFLRIGEARLVARADP